MSHEASRIIHEPGRMIQTAGAMMQPGVPDIRQAGGMSHPGIRMMQTPGWKTGNAGRMSRERFLISPDRDDGIDRHHPHRRDQGGTEGDQRQERRRDAERYR